MVCFTALQNVLEVVGRVDALICLPVELVQDFNAAADDVHSGVAYSLSLRIWMGWQRSVGRWGRDQACRTVETDCTSLYLPHHTRRCGRLRGMARCRSE